MRNFPNNRQPLGFMFDLDGTLLLSDKSLGGYRMIDGADKVLFRLAERKLPYLVFTNGSAYPPPVQAKRLRDLGLPVTDEQMITPSVIAADLMVEHGVKSVLVLGTEGTAWSMQQAGIKTLFPGDANDTAVDAVYVAWAPDCNMDHIHKACEAIWQGAKFYVASNVPFFAAAGGRAMGFSFAIRAAVQAMTKAPMILAGKPSKDALKRIAKRLGIPMTRVAVVGDDPLVETIMANRSNAFSIAVTTGFNKRKDWQGFQKSHQPHLLLDSVADLMEYL